MKQGYLVCAGPVDAQVHLPRALLSSLARHGIAERWRGHRLALYAQDDLPVLPFEDRSGFLIGHLFDGAGTLVQGELAAGLSIAGAEELSEQYWGSYAAFADDGRGFAALRDPSGGLPLYRVRTGGAHFFTSVPHLLVDCGLINAELDWQAVGRSLTRHASRRSDTALRGIEELLPGELLDLGPDTQTVQRIWDPWRHARSSPGAMKAQVAVLEQVLGSTLAAWGRTTVRPLIELSGGLDSAIIAAGIVAAAPDAELITFAAASGDPDEIAYARAIAGHLGRPLEIVHPRVEDVDLTRSLSCNLPRPNARAFTQAADAQSLGHARTIGADAFVSGGGGDDVFCYLRTILPAVDRLGAEGVGGMMRTARDIAIMTHSTVWDAFGRIARRLARGGPTAARADHRLIDQTYLADEVADRPQDSAVEPRDRRLPPGKAEHVEAVLTIHNYLEGHARSAFAPILSPLLSQPIVECCLAVPTWHWCDRGRNRAVARSAFAGRLPRIAIERRSKGSFDGFCARLVHVNRALIGEMLIDGRLAGQGIIDCKAIASALAHPSPSAATVSRILTLVDVESWVQGWATRPTPGD